MAQDAIDAVADNHDLLAGFDMNVARPTGDAVGKQDVHQFHDRPRTRLGHRDVMFGIGFLLVLAPAR